MSSSRKKKKAKKKEEQDLILLVGNVLDEKYQKLTEEIFLMQEEVKRAQKKERRKAIKKMKKGNSLYMPGAIQLRESTIRKLEGGWLDQLIQFLGQLKPLIRAIATCIMELIIGLLSIDAVKYRLQPTTLVKIQEVFTVAKQTSERLV